MRTPFRVLLAVTAALAAAQPAVATPSVHVRAGSERAFEAPGGYGYGYDYVSVRFRHIRGGAGAGTHSGGASGETWEACVYAWSTVSFYGCGTPTAVTFDVPPGTATGRVRFTLRQPYSYGTAVADLTLTDSGGTPGLFYEVYPYGTSVSPTATVTRQAVLKGSVRVTGKRGTRTTTRTFSVTDVPVRLSERAVAGASTYL